MGNIKILLVDDEPDILEFLSYNLLENDFIVETAKNGSEAIKKYEKFQPDIILMDVMMPKMDGVSACKKIKAFDNYNDCTIIFLSARNEEFTQIAAYDAGAHDFINKPVKPAILIKKLHAIVKKNNSKKISTKNGISINQSKHLVFVDGEKTTLTKKQFEILSLLFDQNDIVFSREKLIKKIWGSNYYITPRNIDVQIRHIRKIIGKHRISTIKGLGYRFNSE
tara:strand:- start:4398 stop:5066 length:669 start_codon:yes stop_codon:yes gene_type:complete